MLVLNKNYMATSKILAKAKGINIVLAEKGESITECQTDLQFACHYVVVMGKGGGVHLVASFFQMVTLISILTTTTTTTTKMMF